MKNLLLGFGLMICISTVAQQVSKGITASNGVFIGFYEYKPLDYDANINEKYPLIIFLHGIGERGNGTTELSRVLGNAIPRYINAGHKMRFYWNGKWETFLVLSPQLSPSYGYWPNFYTDEMIRYAKQNMRIDSNRIFLTGLSLGGGGTWGFASASQTNSATLAGIAPVCGTCAMTNGCNIANAKLPVWAFHAADDGSVGAGCTTGAISSINGCNAAVKPYMTIWPTGGHGIWDRAYDTVYNWQNPNIYEWFLGQNRGLPVNARPLANAGNNVTISISTAQVNLSGALSTDGDGNIVRFIWRKISGPTAGSFTAPNAALNRVVGLNVIGVYKYEVTVVDNRADIGKDSVTVTVVSGPVPNIPPVVEAGANQTITTTYTGLNGSATYDPDGTVTAYNWTKFSGPGQYTISNSNIASPTLFNLVPGTYQFILEATDNVGAKNKDTVIITEASEQIPVELLYFKGLSTGSENKLTWATVSEYNNSHFDIERSVDGSYFTAIGTVKGAITSLNKKEYTFSDNLPVQPRYYYRLKQVDVDGKYEYSKIISITNNPGRISYSFFPNPSHSSITITINDNKKGRMEIRLLNIDGKVIQRKELIKVQEVSTTTLQLQHLICGVYLMEIRSVDGSREITKIVKQ